MLIPYGEALQKGMAGLKQVVISMVIVLIAAGILLAMVLYTVVLLRTAQMRMLIGEPVCQRGESFVQPEELETVCHMQTALLENC